MARQADNPTRDKLHKIVQAIHTARTDRKLSQARLAARADMCHTTVAKVEARNRDCYTLINFLKICDALHIKPSDLLKTIDL